MSLPEIDFDKIRSHDNSRNAGFEELCCQLAGLEPREPTATFIRKGRGGDAGVECFVRHPSGQETGWQTKYVADWAAASPQLDKSIRTALNKHPNLDTYIVALPFDLSDARVDGRTSALESWENWKAKWLKVAADEGRPLSIELWAKSSISERLARDAPAYAGRLFYWFDQDALRPNWFRAKLERVKKALGSRYIPETNVELPIRRDFLALARDPSLNDEADDWQAKIQTSAFSVAGAIGEKKVGTPAELVTELDEALNELDQSLGIAPVGPEFEFPISAWLAAVDRSLSASHKVLHWLYAAPRSHAKSGSIDPLDWARHQIGSLNEVLYEIQRELQSQRWKAANFHAVLLHGEAGIGKSHLLADVVEHQIGAERPALLILSSTLTEGEPWHQIMRDLDLPPSLQTKHFLAALDAAAEASDTRALICVDALNERHGLDLWPPRLAAFIEDVRPYPRLAVVVSCRTTYLPHIVPDSISDEELPRILHTGFGRGAGEAAKAYLAKRGIVRPGAPNLLPEFNNPLFLKTCCDALEKQGVRELPRGLRGVTAIFGFYTEAISDALNKRMKLDRHRQFVPRALDAMADALADSDPGYLPVATVSDLFEVILPSMGDRERSLLIQLESEGVVTIEPVLDENGGRKEVVRFTFERFSDHVRAARLLEQHLNTKDPAASFASGQPLYACVADTSAYERAGVVEAMAIQLAEIADVELPDVVADKRRSWIVEDAFVASLLWRDQRKFTRRTLELAGELRGQSFRTDLLIMVGSEPDNAFNAEFLHTKLLATTMPDRDVFWSTALYWADDEDDDGKSVRTLIEWALEHGLESIEDDRAQLAAKTLAWFFSTSNRVVRDRATKALACLLAGRLTIATKLVRDFALVDDLHIRERVLAAVYGAVLQGRGDGELTDLSKAVFETVFADGSPPPHVLLRDYATNILEYISWRGLLPPTLDMTAARPPFRSDWPIEAVPDELIETYKEDWGRGEFRDEIVSSTVNDGDFARYQIDPLAGHWSPAPLGTKKRPHSKDVYKAWVAEFKRGATPAQVSSFDAVLTAAKATQGSGVWQDTPERRALKAVEKSFAEDVGSDVWERYRVTARDYVNHSLFSDHSMDHIRATFNNRWARRWICKRAHDLGWTADRFSKIDRNMGRGSDRHEHAYERVGKKYQWLAFHELAARMADNLAFLHSYRSFRDDPAASYAGALDIGSRDIDPSFLVTGTYYDGWKQWPKTWWLPASPVLRSLPPLDRLAWRDTEDNLINSSDLIELTNPKDRRRWLALHSAGHWRQSSIGEGKKHIERETWFRLNCYVVKKDEVGKLVRGMRDTILTSSHDLPEMQISRENFLGEYPWHPSLSELDEWTVPDEWNKLKAAIKPTAGSYFGERSGYDYSLEQTTNISLPAPWLMRSLGLRLSSGRKPIYVDQTGKVIFFDPSISEPGPAAALVDREAFLTALTKDGLAAVWVIAGEKNVYGGGDPGFGGRRLHTNIYQLTEDGFAVLEHRDTLLPSREQLDALLGAEVAKKLLDKPVGATRKRAAKPVPTAPTLKKPRKKK